MNPNPMAANMVNMAAMGRPPVGAGMPMMSNGAALGPQAPAAQPMPQQAQQQQQQQPLMILGGSTRTTLNSYIYEYFYRHRMFDCARAMYEADPGIRVTKESPSGRRDENGNVNGMNDDMMDTDSKDFNDQKRPNDLPVPCIQPQTLSEGSFLLDWFALFWDMFTAKDSKGPSLVTGYVQHTQNQSRQRQIGQEQMLRQIRPDNFQYGPQMMARLPNGMMAMKGGNLQRAAMVNNQNPTMQMLQQQKLGMQRDPSVEMDGNRPRPQSPGGPESAPSPSKRPRLEGGPFNPGQAIMMANNRPGQGMPGQSQVGPFSCTAPIPSLHSHLLSPHTHTGSAVASRGPDLVDF
jgi:hypothetical protein